MSTTMHICEEERRKKEAYKKLQENKTGLSGIDRCLKPQYNLVDGTIAIKNPYTRKKEVYKKENTFFGTKYQRVK